jgi:predicted component of type VI protein secretion system
VLQVDIRQGLQDSEAQSVSQRVVELKALTGAELRQKLVDLKRPSSKIKIYPANMFSS